MKRNPTRAVRVGPVTIGGGAPIAVQSMAATRTQDVEATLHQVQLLQEAGADLVRIAVDSKKDVAALAEVRARSGAALVVDLQENYRLAPLVAPHVEKLRYNPGHLHHHEKDKPLREKVAFLAETARAHDCALRVGVNCGSVDPRLKERYGDDHVQAIVASALEHCALLDGLGFERYVVSLKDSDWKKVVEANRRFAAERPDVPLHLGVTEAGMPPDGEIKTRVAFEQLISQGIGDTVRVSLTVPFEEKEREVRTARQILADIAAGRLPLRAAQIRRGAEHHRLPLLLAGGERGLRGVGGAGQGDDRLRQRLRHHHRHHGLPRERAGRDRRRRPGAVVRPAGGAPEARRGHDGPVPLRRDPGSTARRARRIDPGAAARLAQRALAADRAHDVEVADDHRHRDDQDEAR